MTLCNDLEDDEITPCPLFLDWQEGYYKTTQSILSWLHGAEAAQDALANFRVAHPDVLPWAFMNDPLYNIVADNDDLPSDVKSSEVPEELPQSRMTVWKKIVRPRTWVAGVKAFRGSSKEALNSLRHKMTGWAS
ncbi:hypothetical protein PMG11_07891 [Penicillium brasilianum]|uniref:Uncharacterized protein n=1 Tax=Penicillium brasilianum TaxID=104259 RepID=A0A0F7TV22_PENBI|nr:hypothetical protein PMG11_07891 [Penicillium brasilianum]